MEEICEKLGQTELTYYPGSLAVVNFIDEINKKIANPGQGMMCLVDSGHHYFTWEIRKEGLYVHNSWYNMFSYEWFAGIIDEDALLRQKDDDTQKKFNKFREECGMGKRLSNVKVALDCFTLILNFKRIKFQFLCAPLNNKFKELF